MKIDRVFVATYPGDLHLTWTCLASIRYWYPRIPISLIKDYALGDFYTGDLERRFHASVLDCKVKCFRGAYGKLEALMLPKGQRVLILDSDVVFLGKVIHRLQRFTADMVVDAGVTDQHMMSSYWYDRDRLRARYPDYDLGFPVFNTGQMVAQTGLFTRADFEPFLRYEPSRVVLLDDTFKAWEQGVTNFVVARKVERGQITLDRDAFWDRPTPQSERQIDLQRLAEDSPYDHLWHWAGYYEDTHRALPGARILAFFKRFAVSGTRPGQRQRSSRSPRAHHSSQRGPKPPRIAPERALGLTNLQRSSKRANRWR